MRKLATISTIPDSLNRHSSVSLQSRKRNLSRIRNYSGATKASLSFPGYQSNKEIIRNLDFGRCAYCGLMIKNTQTETVEHFRPKAELRFRDNYLRLDGIDKPEEKRDFKYNMSAVDPCKYGYFLWGDDAHNLLPACECCNTGQGNNGLYICPPNENSNPGRIEQKIPYGKKVLFPIDIKKNTDKRIGKEFIGSLANEYPLLYNPYSDDPNKLFRYKEPIAASNVSKYIVKIRPNRGLSKREKLKAIVSINTYGLNREFLCIERGDIHTELSAIEESMNDCILRNSSLSAWAFVAIRLAKEFDPQTNSLIGYRLREFGQLVPILHSEIQKNFPDIVDFSKNNSLRSMVDEIFQFGAEHKSRPRASALRDKLRMIR